MYAMHPFPPRWRYDVLQALDYFRDCNALRDPRMANGIELLRRKRMKDQRLLLNAGMAGVKYFWMESVGKPSQMNTLHALRMLNWWNQADGSTESKEKPGEKVCSQP
jgi:hypothetical protein